MALFVRVPTIASKKDPQSFCGSQIFCESRSSSSHLRWSHDTNNPGFVLQKTTRVVPLMQITVGNRSCTVAGPRRGQPRVLRRSDLFNLFRLHEMQPKRTLHFAMGIQTFISISLPFLPRDARSASAVLLS